MSDPVSGTTVAAGGEPDCLAPQLGICEGTLHQYPCHIVGLN